MFKNTRDFIIIYVAIWATVLFTLVVFFSPYVNDAFEKNILAFLFNLITNVLAFFAGNRQK